MSAIDSRGRLFGRLNVLDAVVLAGLLVLVPAIYAAYVLFRVPPPALTAVEPRDLSVSDPMRVRVSGENLMPYLTAYVGRTGEPVAVFLQDRQSSLARFAIESPTAASLGLPQLPPGTYDIYLYSEGQQLVHKEKAFTVHPLPETVIAEVEPSSVEAADQLRLRVRGQNFPASVTAYVGPTGEAISLFREDRVNVVARLTVETPESALLDLQKLPPGRYDLYLYTAEKQIASKINAFTITARPQTAPATAVRSVARVRVHYIVPREYAALPKAGDLDFLGSPTLSGEPDARLVAVVQREMPPSTSTYVVDPVLLVVDVSVPVTRGETGLWGYKGQRIRPGENLAFGTSGYYIYGLIVDAQVPPRAPWPDTR